LLEDARLLAEKQCIWLSALIDSKMARSGWGSGTFTQEQADEGKGRGERGTDGRRGGPREKLLHAGVLSSELRLGAETIVLEVRLDEGEGKGRASVVGVDERCGRLVIMPGGESDGSARARQKRKMGETGSCLD
jgi:hypothetical protein